MQVTAKPFFTRLKALITLRVGGPVSCPTVYFEYIHISCCSGRFFNPCSFISNIGYMNLRFVCRAGSTPAQQTINPDHRSITLLPASRLQKQCLHFFTCLLLPESLQGDLHRCRVMHRHIQTLWPLPTHPDQHQK